jgi:AcrR family transcriptional regulator
MLNKVARTAPTRLPPQDRRAQLVGIGLRMLAERPIHELSLDAVAAQAGISRSLLFHYFPTKSDYYDAVRAAAVRRALRNTAPDDGVEASVALEQIVERMLDYVDRRQEAYLALVYGAGSVPLGGEGVQRLRTAFAARVVEVLGLASAALPVVHAWTAYLEDLALQRASMSPEQQPALAGEVRHAIAALHALLGLGSAAGAVLPG